MNEGFPHILCIDDDRETAGLVAEELTERFYRVTVAHGGEAGFAALQADPPQLVLSDLSMPGVSGLDLLERLGSRFVPVPFIFLTALSDRDTELRARQLGADDYVTKPVDFDILVTIIEARLAGIARRRPRAEAGLLNERETEVLRWAARGKTSAEIAQIVDLSKRTVDFHADNARTKLNAATRIEAAIKAAAIGLIDI